MNIFTSGHQAVIGHGIREVYPTGSARDAGWAEAVLEAAAYSQVRAHCALSFVPGGEGVAVLPELSEVVPYDQIEIADVAGLAGVEVTPVPAPADYAAMVRAALERIEAGEVEKVVLGRQLQVRAPGLRPEHLLRPLLDDRPGEYVFSQTVTGGEVAVGASPELLVRRVGTAVSSVPLAGSVPRAADPDEDRRRAEELLRSAKDLAEHAHVVEAITAALAPLCGELDWPRTPILHRTDTLWHLATPIHGRLLADRPLPSALELAQLLHPTPAVGGVPAARAAALIAELEPTPRGYLAGCVGWLDGAGDGEFAVTIRAGIVGHDELQLFAGAGIVAGSVPDSEVRETGAKLSTMLRALERSPAGALR
ncbi:isochorismate synthase MenF [Nocardioides sp. Bht2]|uniref:isochorismate synthase n=1 Tax=Nocardioides sp. Bht2 TaxID=3392297 RepID=UPI0039B5DE4F